MDAAIFTSSPVAMVTKQKPVAKLPKELPKLFCYTIYCYCKYIAYELIDSVYNKRADVHIKTGLGYKQANRHILCVDCLTKRIVC